MKPFKLKKIKQRREPMAEKNAQKFLLIQEVEAECFEQAVNGNLDEGWKLYGPPFSHNGALVQAMTFCGTVKK